MWLKYALICFGLCFMTEVRTSSPAPQTQRDFIAELLDKRTIPIGYGVSIADRHDGKDEAVLAQKGTNIEFTIDYDPRSTVQWAWDGLKNKIRGRNGLLSPLAAEDMINTTITFTINPQQAQEIIQKHYTYSAQQPVQVQGVGGNGKRYSANIVAGTGQDHIVKIQSITEV